MKNIINLPYPPFATILVAEGDNITPKTVLLKCDQNQESETIHIAKLLGVSSDKISKYMRKKTGEKITVGEILAERRGIFSSSFVRSPISGEIGRLDLSRGVLGLIKFANNSETDFSSFVHGKVISIGKSAIEVETENTIFQAVKGEGKDVKGELRYMVKAEVGVQDSFEIIEDSIILCQSASEATFVKFSVLGVKGLIVTKMKKEMVLPWVLVDGDNFVKLEKYKDQKIWLRPKDKQIVILDE